MVSKTVTVINAEGMHMRPAGMIAKSAKAHTDSEIILKVGDKEIKATGVMQIMAAGIKKGTDVEIIVNGGDESSVLKEFVSMFEDGFGE
ncbi:MAG: HPr family phosphocarrier protein [Acutalibacteraceae bacterium]|nr:HPr family phosphocarrier protein [Acutalibacteraceae bacterium]